MPVGKMILHRFNGDEIFNVESATIDYYKDEDGSFATSFRAETSRPPIQTLPDTEDLQAEPTAEITLTFPKVPGLMLLAGCSYSLPRGYNDDTGVHQTNFCYVEHEILDDNEIVVLARRLDCVQLRITGTTIDVNYYDGSKPPTKIVIEAEFTLTP